MTVAVMNLWGNSMPGGDWLVVTVVLAMVGLVAPLWLFVAARRAARFRRWAPLRDRWFAASTALLLGSFAIGATDVPVRLRFEASRPAFEALAAEIAVPGAPTQLSDRSLGLYQTSSVEQTATGLRVLVEGCGFINSCGFAYSVDGLPETVGDDLYRHLTGPWWIWDSIF